VAAKTVLLDWDGTLAGPKAGSALALCDKPAELPGLASLR
jgi:hypothetical protein